MRLSPPTTYRSREPKIGCPISRALCEKWGLSNVLLNMLLGTLLLASASAQTLTGTVTNGTTKKPAAGDDVVLLSLGQGMEESGRTQTDAKGNFSLKLDNATSPHLVRVIHQGVTYHRMAPPGTTSVEVQVYDVAKKVEGISVTADVMRFQAQGSELQGIRLFAVNNTSDPPRTQMSDQSFEFYLPDGAQVDQSMAMTAGGQPINSAPVPQKEKNRYAFLFPLRPGETQFQVSYHMPYSGEASFNPKTLYGAQHFVVVLPKTMQFSASPGATFQSMQDPRQADSVVQVASNTTRRPSSWLQDFWDRHDVRRTQRKPREAAAPSAARRPAAQSLDAIPVPAADSARRSTLPTRWKNIAGTFSEASELYWRQAPSTSPAAPRPPLSSIMARPMSNWLTFPLLRKPSPPTAPPCYSRP